MQTKSSCSFVNSDSTCALASTTPSLLRSGCSSVALDPPQSRKRREGASDEEQRESRSNAKRTRPQLGIKDLAPFDVFIHTPPLFVGAAYVAIVDHLEGLVNGMTTSVHNNQCVSLTENDLLSQEISTLLAHLPCCRLCFQQWKKLVHYLLITTRFWSSSMLSYGCLRL